MATGLGHLLSIGLGLFYCTTGLPKLFSFIPAHRVLKDDFVKFATVFPLKPLGIVPNPTLYMYAVGVIEFGAGVMLGLGSHEQQVTSAMVLFGIMVGGLYTLVSLGRKQTDWIPPIVCMALLGLYLFQTL
ncbi:PREDICTED: transmembrane protein 35B-like isoform X1 [Branchiostoma belcheri]|uniref:Transmembrane protein 35B-like isoform X1 n=1 Tax=Branchiostoma belcheri TaxID=7741 RepID=A0A6P4YM23_BRABE|nr:PREDICTED: transmembrane protein 35B-like isoform X1 [Branchiostoma belcheri]